jgi:HD-GYP domain-containing protein (c-di-GMP phosphodiesterase class II)
MEGADRRRMRKLGFYAAIAVLAGVAVVLLGLALGASLHTTREAALPLAVIAIGAGLVALVGWRDEQRARDAFAGREAAARERIDTELRRDDGSGELRERIASLESELAATAGEHARLEARAREAEERRERELGEARERHRRELASEREARTRTERARRAEREWNRELRTQVATMHRQRGTLGDTDDIRALVLHIAVTLLEAEKGLLLRRVDTDGDGDLDLVCSEGFENDARHSALAQRFATEVIERDVTVREDGHEVDGENATAADREIQNLVAIPIYVQDEFSGVVVCANKDGGFHEYDDEVLLALGDQAGAVLDNTRLRGDLRSAYVSTVRLLAEAIEAKDPFLRGHSDEVSEYVAAVADKMGIERDRREELVFGSLLHDVGKIGISERILLKPAKLTDEEFGVVKLHPRIGYRLIDQVKALQPIAHAILHHHERWDGDGYPDGLAGDEIPLEARIICVADSFSAMTAERPYRKRMSLDQACAELERCAGTQFDPEVVRVFVEEVRCRPASEEAHPLEEALRDPVIEASRDGGEPLLGYGPLAVTDNLTLLYTHRYFHEIADRSAGGGEPFAVVLAELTDVAQLNQLEGYAAGDEAIRAAARAVQRAAVRCGGTACRYSGRRLGLIVPGAGQEAAERVALELASDLADGPRVAVGAGAAHDGDRGYDVIARARLALSPGAPVSPPA